MLCPVKFVHLNRVPCRWYEFRPYDLVVVPEHKARTAPKRTAFATLRLLHFAFLFGVVIVDLTMFDDTMSPRVSPRQVDPEHFTMSPKGVVHVWPGQPSARHWFRRE